MVPPSSAKRGDLFFFDRFRCLAVISLPLSLFPSTSNLIPNKCTGFLHLSWHGIIRGIANNCSFLLITRIMRDISWIKVLRKNLIFHNEGSSFSQYCGWYLVFKEKKKRNFVRFHWYKPSLNYVKLKSCSTSVGVKMISNERLKSLFRQQSQI